MRYKCQDNLLLRKNVFHRVYRPDFIRVTKSLESVHCITNLLLLMSLK